MTCANVLVWRVKDYEGRGLGRCWTGDGGAAICVAPAKGATATAHTPARSHAHFNPRSGAARHIALHELLGTQYACQEDHFELQQTAENIS